MSDNIKLNWNNILKMDHYGEHFEKYNHFKGYKNDQVAEAMIEENTSETILQVYRESNIYEPAMSQASLAFIDTAVKVDDVFGFAKFLGQKEFTTFRNLFPQNILKVLLAILRTVWLFHKITDLNVRLVALGFLASDLILEYPCISLCISTLEKVIKGLVSTGPVAMSTSGNVLDIWNAILEFFAGIFRLKNKSEVTYDKVLVDQIKNSWLMIRTLSDLGKWLFEWVTKGFLVVREYVTGYSEAQRSLFSQHPRYKEWVDGVMAIHAAGGEVLVKSNLEAANQIEKLWQVGNEFMELSRNSGMTPEQRNCFAKVYSLNKQLFEASMAIRQGDKMRPEPFLLSIFGGTGTGKSTLVPLISRTLARCYGEEYNDETLIYSYRPDAKYFDGYHNQFVFLMDEVGQSKNCETNEQESNLIFSAVNSVPFPLNMACVEDKGNYRFTSKVLLTTSNFVKPNYTGVNCDEALLRRRNMVVKVERNEKREHPVPEEFAEFCVRASGLSCPSDSSTGLMRIQPDFDPNHFLFTIWNYGIASEEEREPDYKRVNLFEFSKILVQKFLKDTDARSRLVGSLDRVSEYLANMVKAEIIPTTTVYEETHVKTAFLIESKRFYVLNFLDRLRNSVAVACNSITPKMKSMLDIKFEDYSSTFNNKIDVTEEYIMQLFETGRVKTLAHIAAMSGFVSDWMMFVNYKLGAYHKSLTERQQELYDAWIQSFKGKTFFNIDVSRILTQIWNQIKFKDDACKVISFVVTGLTLVGGVAWYKMKDDKKFNNTSEIKVITNCAEGIPSGDQVTRNIRGERRSNIAKRIGRTQMKVRGRDAKMRHAEGSDDVECFRLARQLYIHNCAHYNIVGAGVNDCHGILLCNNVFLTNYHMSYLLFQEYNYVNISFCGSGQVLKIPVSEIKVRDVAPLDLALWLLPEGLFKRQKSLIKHFITEADMQNLDFQRVALLTADADGRTLVINTGDVDRVGGQALWGETDFDTSHDDPASITLIDSVKYRVDTYFGLCGSMVLAVNKALGRKIIGFHCSGTMESQQGWCNVLTQEVLIEQIKEIEREEGIHILDITDEIYDIEKEMVIDNMIESKEAKQNFFTAEDSVEVIGNVAKQFSVYQPTKTTIEPSLLHDQAFKATTKPALLKRMGDIDPYRGLLKYSGPVVFINNKILTRIQANLCSVLNKCTFDIKRTLSVMEAINGMNYKHFEKMNLMTSPGIPYTYCKGCRHKQDFVCVDANTGKYVPKDFLAKNVTRRIKALKDGNEYPTFWSDFLKDERLPVEKVDIGKTRFFMCAPMDFTIVFRMYNLAFIAMIMRNKMQIFNECAVGINVHSEEWDHLYRDLISVDKDHFFVCGDFSSFDGSITPQLVDIVCAIVNWWYGDTNIKEREVLFETIKFPYHIVGNTMYRCSKGNPSGNPMTTIMNSLINSILIQYAWIVLSQEYGKTYPDYFIFVKAKNYGDDNIICVSKQVPWFNLPNISGVLKQIGFTYTASKERPDEITFLKRGFRYDSELNRYLPNLSKSSINEMVNWVRKSSDPAYACATNIITANREMFYWGKLELIQWQKQLQKALDKNNIILTLPDYYELKKAYLTSNLHRPFAQFHKQDNEDDLTFGEDSFKDDDEPIVRPSFRDSVVRQPLPSSCTTFRVTAEPIMAQSGPGPDEIPLNVSTEEMTTFVDEAKPIVETAAPVDSKISVDPEIARSIESFLKQPREICGTVWRASQTAGMKIEELHFPESLFKIKAIMSKIRNFKYFRGDIKIGIRINGTKFHYGRLLLSWCPARQLTMSQTTYTSNIYYASCCPHVVVSPTESCTNIMTVPYTLPYPFLDVSTTTKEIGCLRVYVLNPLVVHSSASTDVDFTIYANFENIMFTGLTSFVRAIAQGGTSSESLQKQEKGVVSGIAEQVSTIAGSLTKVPLISSAAAVVSGVAKGVGMVASTLGYCKPNIITTVEHRVLKCYNNAWSHGVEQAPMMALFPDNKVGSNLESMGSFSGEMDILHIAQTPSLLHIFRWEAGVDSHIMHGQVSPMISPYQKEAKDSLVFCPTLLAWVTNSCQFWRGSLKFIFQFTCSSFHSGRVRIFWDPHTNMKYDKEELANAMNLVVDVQDNTEVVLVVPYLRQKPWLSVHKHPKIPFVKFTGDDLEDDHCNGVIGLDVVNKLTYPTAPIPPVYINVWVCACQDFQIAFPTTQYLTYEFTVPVPPPVTMPVYGKYRAFAAGMKSSANVSDVTTSVVERVKYTCTLNAASTNTWFEFRLNFPEPTTLPYMTPYEITVMVTPNVGKLDVLKLAVADNSIGPFRFDTARQKWVSKQVSEVDEVGTTFKAYFSVYLKDPVVLNYSFSVEADFESTYNIAEGMTQNQLRNAVPTMNTPLTGIIDKDMLMGEQITTIKDIIRRPSTTGMRTLSPNIQYFYPSYFGCLDTPVMSYLYWFSKIFRFCRGSVVHKFMITGAKSMSYGWEAFIWPMLSTRSGVGTLDSNTALAFLGNGCQIFRGYDNPTVEGTVPFYSSEYFAINKLTKLPSEGSQELPGCGIQLKSSYTAINCDTIHFISAGDDFEFGFLVGPPECKYSFKASPANVILNRIEPYLQPPEPPDNGSLTVSESSGDSENHETTSASCVPPIWAS